MIARQRKPELSLHNAIATTQHQITTQHTMTAHLAVATRRDRSTTHVWRVNA